MGRGMTAGSINTDQHELDGKPYLSSFLAMTMRWIWLVPS